MSFEVAQLAQEVNRYEPFDTLSFLMGFESAIRLFGVWKDGEQYLGSSGLTVRDVMKTVSKYSSPEVQK